MPSLHRFMIFQFLNDPGLGAKQVGHPQTVCAENNTLFHSLKWVIDSDDV